MTQSRSPFRPHHPRPNASPWSEEMDRAALSGLLAPSFLKVAGGAVAGWRLALVGCGPTAPPNLAPEMDSGSDFEFNVVMVNRWSRIRKVERHRAEYSREFLQTGVALDCVKIPGGAFMMGKPEHEPERIFLEAPQRPAAVPTSQARSSSRLSR